MKLNKLLWGMLLSVSFFLCAYGQSAIGPKKTDINRVVVLNLELPISKLPSLN